jgi:hypothetical protein
MNTAEKLEVLKTVYTDEAALDRLLAKLLETVLAENRLRLQRYEQALREFETRYTMASDTFYQRFQAGELGDAMDFFEWAGLYDLRQDLLAKIARLEAAV